MKRICALFGLLLMLGQLIAVPVIFWQMLSSRADDARASASLTPHYRPLPVIFVRGKVLSAVISADGERLFTAFDSTGYPQDKLMVWHTPSGQCSASGSHGQATCVYSVAITPDACVLASCSDDIRLWTANQDGSGYHHCRVLLQAKNFPAFGSSGNSIALTPDGRSLVVGGYTHIPPPGKHAVYGEPHPSVTIWDTHTGVRTHLFLGHQRTIEAVDISSDGLKVVSLASAEKTVRLWDVPTGEHETIHLNARSEWPHGAVFTPDNRSLVLATTAYIEDESGQLRRFGLVRTYDLSTLLITAEHEVDNDCVFAVTRDHLVLSDSREPCVKVIHHESNRLVATLPVRANLLTVTPDTKTLVCVDYDRPKTTIRLYQDPALGTSSHEVPPSSAPLPIVTRHYEIRLEETNADTRQPLDLPTLEALSS